MKKENKESVDSKVVSFISMLLFGLVLLLLVAAGLCSILVLSFGIRFLVNGLGLSLFFPLLLLGLLMFFLFIFDVVVFFKRRKSFVASSIILLWLVLAVYYIFKITMGLTLYSLGGFHFLVPILLATVYLIVSKKIKLYLRVV